MPEIHTDAAGLEAGSVSIAAAGGAIPGYCAKPVGRVNVPIILVVQEIFGVNEHIRDVCRRLAKLGYCAIAPELFARQGDVSQMKDWQEIFAKIVSKTPDAQVLADLDAAADEAARIGGDIGRLGITGFCWGGRITWLYAAHSSRAKAAVAWYGRFEGDTDALHPRHPIDVAGELNSPVLGLYGAQDQSIPQASVTRMREAIAHARKNAEIVLYSQAGHAFFADYRPSFEKGAAEEGWHRMREWFRYYGVAPQ